MDEAVPGINPQALAAGTLGNGGVCLFALDLQGALWFRSQQGAGGAWTAWQGPKFAAQPGPGRAIAVAGQNNGLLMLVMLDDTGMAWSMSQTANGTWADWQGPGIAGEKFGFGSIAAGEQSGPRGIQLFAADDPGTIWACYQMNPGADWSGWSKVGTIATPGWGEVALGGQNNGCLMLVAESTGTLMSYPQTQPGGAWGNWGTLNPGLPLVNGICACQQGGSRGVELWALDTDEATLGQVWTIFQDSAGGVWDRWRGPGFYSQPEMFLTIAAAEQGNGCAMLFGVGVTGNLWAIGQLTPGGGWGGWARLDASADSDAGPAQTNLAAC